MTTHISTAPTEPPPPPDTIPDQPRWWPTEAGLSALEWAEQRETIRDALDSLLAKLPRCEERGCGAVATVHSHAGLSPIYLCDRCTEGLCFSRTLPWADAVRALMLSPLYRVQP